FSVPLQTQLGRLVFCRAAEAFSVFGHPCFPRVRSIGSLSFWDGCAFARSHRGGNKMFSCDYLLALALLTNPPDALDRIGVDHVSPELRLSLQVAAIELEILDPREVRYILCRHEDVGSDLNLLRRRYSDLAEAPPLVDGARFPDRDTVNSYLTFNRAYRQ